MSTVRVVLLALVVPLMSAGCPSWTTPGCFERHVLDAMALNRARLPAYSVATDARSEEVSLGLIRSERGALIAARYFDRRARPLREAGIPALCAELVEMEHTPPLIARTIARPRPPARLPDVAAIRGRIRRVWRQEGYAGAWEEAHRAVTRLERNPHYNCMVRHLLESVRLAAALAPVHARAVSERGFDPEVSYSLSRHFMELQLAFLESARRLDEQAAPLQAEGVPIICRDVPPIPARLEGAELSVRDRAEDLDRALQRRVVDL